MTAIQFLDHLRALGAQLRVEDGRLSCEAPRRVLTPEVVRELSAQKAEIIGLLSSHRPVQPGHPVLTGEDGLLRAHRHLQEAVDEVAATWNGLPRDHRPDLDPEEDRRLEEAINLAFRSCDPQAAMQAVAGWRSAWGRLLQAPEVGPRPPPRVRWWLDVVEEAMARLRKAERRPKRKAPVPDAPTGIGPPGNRVDLSLTEAERGHVDQAWVNRMLAKVASGTASEPRKRSGSAVGRRWTGRRRARPRGSPLLDGDRVQSPDEPLLGAGPQPGGEGHS